MSQVYLAVLGVGGVGTAFLRQLTSLPPQIAPTLILISSSTRTIWSEDYRPLPSPSPSLLQLPTTPPSLSLIEIATYLAAAPGPAVLIDNTSSPAVAEAYPSFLQKSISVVTANKKPFSGSLGLFSDIFAAASTANALVYHESSVGAGLPVLSTLKDLIATGDRIVKIVGVFSGTMSYLFNEFAPLNTPADTQPKAWSEIVTRAREMGFTEPDPRDDLNGMDVARKCTILARLAGVKVEAPPEAFAIESLIPDELAAEESVEGFLARLKEFDPEMEKLRDDAVKQGKLVRYLGEVDVGAKKVRVGLEMVERDGPVAGLGGSDNLFAFYTERYGERPLVVQGAGAGGEVTAMGVLADLIKVVERIG